MSLEPSGTGVSLVVPVYNEVENLEPLYEALQSVIGALAGGCEVVLVDDGSTDGSAERLDDLAQRDPRFVVVHLRRNSGKSAALSAGFDQARGEFVVTLDADLQDDPADIPALLAKLAEGFDLVSGWRRKRQDAWANRILPSRLANWLISRVTGVCLHDYGCGLKAYRREILQDLRLYGGMHRFIPALARQVGARVTELEVTHHPRLHGRSKYGLSRIPRVVMDLMTVKFLLSYATRPMQVFGGWGLLSGALGLVLGLYLAYQRLVLRVPLSGRPALLLAVGLVVTGAQFVTFGLDRKSVV
jgi:glycosyltransferase involved in cell wall biosynthesis